MKKLLLGFGTLFLFSTAVAQQSYNPAAAATALFQAYQSTIEQKERALVQPPTAVTGDLNGDGLEDCILYFVLTPKEGGNAIVGRQAAVYLNTGRGMKVDGAFPKLKYCFVVDRIAGGTVYVDRYECAPPYNTRIGTYRYHWVAQKLVAVK